MNVHFPALPVLVDSTVRKGNSNHGIPILLRSNNLGEHVVPVIGFSIFGSASASMAGTKRPQTLV